MKDLEDVKELHSKLLAKCTYNPDDGHFRDNKNGRILGGVNPSYKNEYWRINFEGKQRSAHLLAWFYVHGVFPSGQIDHINGNKIDNRICNLRECSISENLYNKPIHPLNTSGFKGVSFNKACRSWAVSVTKDRVRHHVYGFSTKELAYDFSCLLRKLLHGEFARDH